MLLIMYYLPIFSIVFCSAILQNLWFHLIYKSYLFTLVPRTFCFFWIPLFKKKSYFLYFISFNYLIKYWYVMFNLIYYHLYIKIIKRGSYPTFKLQNRFNKLSYQSHYLFLIILVSIFNSINYIYVLALHTGFYFFFIECTSFFSLFWQFVKKPLLLLYLYNYIYKYRYTLFKSWSFNLNKQYFWLIIIFKKYIYNYIYFFFKNLKNIFLKKKNYFFKKFFLYLIIFFCKQFIKKKIFFFITRAALLYKFLQKKLFTFLTLNKKYKYTVNRFFLYTFFYLYFYILMYKNITIGIDLWFYLLTFNIWKKHRLIYYFLRYNILYVFQYIYKKFNIYGFKLNIGGKYATFAGGRKKKFTCYYRNFSFQNFTYYIKYLSTTTFSKLGAAEFKMFLIYK
jgi:hypothetical protein